LTQERLPSLDDALLRQLQAGYGATRSAADLAIWRMLRVYETARGITPLVGWGEAAQHSACHSDIPEGAALAALLDSAGYVQMVTHALSDGAHSFAAQAFAPDAAGASVGRSSHGGGGATERNDWPTEHETDDALDGGVVGAVDGSTGHSVVRDVRWLLPFCDAVLQSETTSRRCIDLGVAGYVLAAMASPELDVRTLAYHAAGRMLEKFTEDAAFAQRFQVILLLHALRTAITSPFQRLPALITAFCAASMPVLVRPEHALYTQLNRFLLQRPSLDLGDIPMFYQLFNSAAPAEYKTERAWILRILCRGVAPTGLDLPIFRRRHVFPMLMSFFNASFSDAFTCRLVLQTLERAVAVPPFLVLLVETNGLVAWLVQLLSLARLGAAAAGATAPSIGAAAATHAGSPGAATQEQPIRILGTVLRLLSQVLSGYRVLQRTQNEYVVRQFRRVLPACLEVLPALPWGAGGAAVASSEVAMQAEVALWLRLVVEPGLVLMHSLLGQPDLTAQQQAGVRSRELLRLAKCAGQLDSGAEDGSDTELVTCATRQLLAGSWGALVMLACGRAPRPCAGLTVSVGWGGVQAAMATRVRGWLFRAVCRTPVAAQLRTDGGEGAGGGSDGAQELEEAAWRCVQFGVDFGFGV
jgi:hypothetical protein